MKKNNIESSDAPKPEKISPKKPKKKKLTKVKLVYIGEDAQNLTKFDVFFGTISLYNSMESDALNQLETPNPCIFPGIKGKIVGKYDQKTAKIIKNKPKEVKFYTIIYQKFAHLFEDWAILE